MADDLNKDGMANRAKGLGKQVEGKVRNTVGGLTGDSSEQLKGKAEEFKGKAQSRIGEAQQDLDRARRERNLDRDLDRDIDEP
jgi:uncharacterized protein YjbJ (UPF0337 family)